MEWTVEERTRLDRFLAEQSPEQSRTAWARAISEGKVTVEGEQATKPGQFLDPGDVVEAEPPEPRAPQALEPVPIPLDVPFEDAHLLVVDKPRGLAVHPSSTSREPTLVHALLARSHSLSAGSAPYRPGIVHRLDKETTGLIMVAKTDRAHADLALQIQERTASRVYVAVVQGLPDKERFIVDAPLGKDPRHPLRRAVVAEGKPAVTHVRFLRTVDAGSLLAVRLETGRTHQIRVHLAACGLAVLGDALYAAGAWAVGPLQLHAARLGFRHPATGEPVTVYAPRPDGFVADWSPEELEV
jgi:23S rRNA pseudouridine1911/1915/1917 synthase